MSRRRPLIGTTTTVGWLLLILLHTLINKHAVDAFAMAHAGGGRAPSLPDESFGIDPDTPWTVTPDPSPSTTRLIVLQITDVYTLDHLASFQRLLEETRAHTAGSGTTVVSVLTGDFLAPYLLSAVDRGAGMMRALQSIPIDYITWGNHEADVNHATVCQHVKRFHQHMKRTTTTNNNNNHHWGWLNSNMLDHEAMEYQKEYDVVELTSADGRHTRRVGLCAVLSDAEGLYAHFKPPGAFNGATITDPWKALAKYQHILEHDEHCDLVLPLQHLYVPDDLITCRDFDFPVLLSGHDHHKVDTVVNGTRLLKPGMNAEYATVLEITWDNNDSDDEQQQEPDISARFVRCSQWEPCPELQARNDQAYDVLLPMRNTELARVPPTFHPLSSAGSRSEVCTMGQFMCSLIKSAMNVARRQRNHGVDAVLLMGGNIRGNTEYEEGAFFSLEALEAEVKPEEVVAVVPMPGWLLAQGVQETHAGDPVSGWMQFDTGVVEVVGKEGALPVVTDVANAPLDPERIYRVATKISDLTNGQSPSWTEYYSENAHVLPPKGAYVNVHAELMSYFARNLWRKIWDDVSVELEEECGLDGEDCNPKKRLELLDVEGDGEVTMGDIQEALRNRLGYSVDEKETTLASFVHSFADTTGDGRVTRADLEVFCDEMDALMKNDSWRLAYEKPNQQVLATKRQTEEMQKTN